MVRIKKRKSPKDVGVVCYAFDSQMGFWGVPNLDISLNFGRVKHDEDGNRNFEVQAKQTEKNILCYGGSHTWGGGVPQELRYTDLLGKKLKRKVINIGHCSFGLDQVCLAILNRSAKYRPEIIVIEQYPWAVHRILNNYVNGYVKPYFYLDPNKKIKLKEVPLLAKYKFFRSLIGQYYAFRKEIREFDLGMNIKHDYDPTLDPIFLYWKTKQYAGMYELLDQILSIIAGYCKKNEIKLIFALGAINQQFGLKSQSNLIDYELPKKRLIDLLNKNKISYLDMTNAMISEHSISAPVIFNDGHINIKGHKVFSDTLAKDMVKRRWVLP